MFFPQTCAFAVPGIHMNQITGKLFEPNDLIPGELWWTYEELIGLIGIDENTVD